jgi:hypothetical protein
MKINGLPIYRRQAGLRGGQNMPGALGRACRAEH